MKIQQLFWKIKKEYANGGFWSMESIIDIRKHFGKFVAKKFNWGKLNGGWFFFDLSSNNPLSHSYSLNSFFGFVLIYKKGKYCCIIKMCWNAWLNYYLNSIIMKKEVYLFTQSVYWHKEFWGVANFYIRQRIQCRLEIFESFWKSGNHKEKHLKSL